MRQKTELSFKRSTDLLRSKDKHFSKKTPWKESMTPSALLFNQQNKKLPRDGSMKTPI